MDRNQVIEALGNAFYDANMSDRALMREWIMYGASLPGYANMTNDQLVAEYEEMFDEQITID